MMAGILVTGMFPLVSCDDKEIAKSGEKELSNFRVAAGGKIFTGVLQNDGKTIKFTVDFGFDQEQLKTATPSFDLSKKAVAEPASGVPQDFTKDVIYTVTAEDGTTAVYTVQKIDGTTSDAAILSFSLYAGGAEFEGVIDEENSVITVSTTAEVWNFLNEAMPTILLSPGATCDPASGVAQDFTQSSVVYTVTAYDGTTREWTVRRSSRTGAAIDFFYLKPEGYDRIVGTINSENHTVTIDAYPVFNADFLPADLTIAPEVIQISPGATVSPDWDVPCDFSQNVTYTVTAENGDQQQWTIIVPQLYVKEKWNVDALNVFPAGAADGQAEAITSLGLIGNYVAFARSTVLLNKSDGTLASGAELDTAGFFHAHGNHPPFFITNDGEGNLVGCTLGAWKAALWSVFKWTAYNAAPVKILEFPTVAGERAAPSLGRKFTVVGDINGTAKIISSDYATRTDGGHYLWSVTGGVVDATGEYLATGVEAFSYAYQVLTPLSPDNNNAFYLGNHFQSGKDDVRLKYGSVGNWTDVKGPLATYTGWGMSGMFLHQKQFSFNGKNYLAVATADGTNSNLRGYYFTLAERHADNTHTFPANCKIPYDADDTHKNGNATGSLTLEKVGNDVFIYLLATGQAVVCYQMSAF
jgi:hypothetical protein